MPTTRWRAWLHKLNSRTERFIIINGYGKTMEVFTEIHIESYDFQETYIFLIRVSAVQNITLLLGSLVKRLKKIYFERQKKALTLKTL